MTSGNDHTQISSDHYFYFSFQVLNWPEEVGQVKLSSSKDRGTEEYLRKSKIGVVSRVISATESDSEESKLNFLPPPLMTLSLTTE